MPKSVLSSECSQPIFNELNNFVIRCYILSDCCAIDEDLERDRNVIRRALTTYFSKLAILSSRHPINVIIISVLICCSCALGFLNFRLETNQEPQWSATNSIWTDYKSRYEAIYGPFYGYATVLAMVRANKLNEVNGMVVNKFVLLGNWLRRPHSNL